MNLKCDMCGKEKSEEMIYLKSWDRVTSNDKLLWKAREEGNGFEGWILIGETCRKLLISITNRNCMKNDVIQT